MTGKVDELSIRRCGDIFCRAFQDDSPSNEPGTRRCYSLTARSSRNRWNIRHGTGNLKVPEYKTIGFTQSFEIAFLLSRGEMEFFSTIVFQNH